MRTYRNPAWCGAMLALVIICGIGGTAAAQWLSLPLPGTPRTADGKPNLNAPTPNAPNGKPDLSGIWRADTMRYNENLLPEGTEAPMLPWAAELYKHRVDDARLRQADDLLYAARRARCDDGCGTPVQDHPDAGRDDRPVRGIPWVPPDSHRRAAAAGRSGSSVVRLSRSAGGRATRSWSRPAGSFKEGSWLDNNGHPHTEALRTTERFRRINFGHMELAGDGRRPEGVLTALDVGHASLHAAARHRAARASLREQQGPGEPAAVLEGTGAGHSIN